MEEEDLYGNGYSMLNTEAVLTAKEVLSIQRGATKVEIKKAYHKVRLTIPGLRLLLFLYFSRSCTRQAEIFTAPN